MAQPKTLSEAREALANSLANETALNAAVEALKKSQGELEAENARLNEWASGLDLNSQNLAQQISELKSECDALKAAAALSETKVTEAVANLGVPPVAIASQPYQAPTKSELWAEYHKLPVEARNAFYKANREAMKD